MGLMTYGQRFRALRKQHWKGRVIDLAKRLTEPGKAVYVSTVYNIEARWRIPALDTIVEHATALGCHPWQLLQGVETEFHLGEAVNRLSGERAEQAWKDLMARYQTTKKGKHGRPRARAAPAGRSPAKAKHGAA